MIEIDSFVPGERLLLDDEKRPTQIIYELPVEARRHYTHPRSISYPLRRLMVVLKNIYQISADVDYQDHDRFALRGVLLVLMRNAPFRYQGIYQNGSWIHRTTPLQVVDPDPILKGYSDQIASGYVQSNCISVVIGINMMNYMITGDQKYMNMFMNLINEHLEFRGSSAKRNSYHTEMVYCLYDVVSKMLDADKRILNPRFVLELLYGSQ